MANIDTLRKRLEKVNTELNAIEEGWPHRTPTSGRSSLELHADKGVPQYAKDVALKAIAPLVEEFRGWEFMLQLTMMGGVDPVALMEIYLNGSCFASVRFFAGDEPGLKTAAHCIRRCTELFPQLAANAAARLRTYPLKTFKSKRYKQLCQLRRKLNQQWHNIPQTAAAKVPGPYAYPYGEHKPGWPVFEGMQLGK